MRTYVALALCMGRSTTHNARRGLSGVSNRRAHLSSGLCCGPWYALGKLKSNWL